MSLRTGKYVSEDTDFRTVKLRGERRLNPVGDSLEEGLRGFFVASAKGRDYVK